MRFSDAIVPITTSVFAAGFVGLVVARASGSGAGLAVGAFLALGGVLWSLRRPLRARRAVREPFPDAWRRWLDARVPIYAQADPDGRARFERTVQLLLDAWSVEGVDGVEVTDELRLSVAAGAGVMLHGRPDWSIPRGRSVLLYPGTFDDEYATDEPGAFDGMANPQGPIVLSAPAVERGWARADGQNVVLHELAHVFDFDGLGADGAPEFLDPRSHDAWRDLVEREMRRAERGDGVLRAYAATAPAELLAVSTEQFFERPTRLRASHPELYDALRAMYNLDPPPEAERPAPTRSLMSRRWD